jgi:hypothetical protein
MRLPRMRAIASFFLAAIYLRPRGVTSQESVHRLLLPGVAVATRPISAQNCPEKSRSDWGQRRRSARRRRSIERTLSQKDT